MPAPPLEQVATILSAAGFPSLAWIGLEGSVGPLWGYPRATQELAFRRVSGTARPRRKAHAGSGSLEYSAAANHAGPTACDRTGQIHRRRRVRRSSRSRSEEHTSE